MHPERVRGPYGLTPTQVRDDPTTRLTELEEDEEENLSRNLGGQTHQQTKFRLSVPACILRIRAGRKYILHLKGDKKSNSQKSNRQKT